MDPGWTIVPDTVDGYHRLSQQLFTPRQLHPQVGRLQKEEGSLGLGKPHAAVGDNAIWIHLVTWLANEAKHVQGNIEVCTGMSVAHHSQHVMSFFTLAR